ncbi:MAG: SagB family peptide dehydrogenase, partial [Thermodesulfobacteriota bacterium]
MDNDEVRYAVQYHEETKHSEVTLQMSRHYLDWDDKPRPFKVYHDPPSIPLPQDFPIPTADALTCISSLHPLQPESPLDICALAQILFFSAGITREMKYDSGTYYMRAASA